jgi:hypothetical protein
VIKHGKIHPVKKAGTNGKTPSHLVPIMKFVTKGIADARERIVLSPQSCDVRGAKRFNGQHCVIARALTRTFHPKAVAVGRSLAYAVFDGIAVRFRVPTASRHLVEEFDATGKVKKADIILDKMNPTWNLAKQRSKKQTNKVRKPIKTKRNNRYGVRAIGGGITGGVR